MSDSSETDGAQAPPADTPSAAPALPVRHAPEQPTPPVVADTDTLAECLADLAAAAGPFAVDVERAGSYRYTQRAYLIQITRADARIWLIDPIAVPSLGDLGQLLAADEWVLHAASQDLPSLAELELHPPSVFDTELAGRLLGLERVGLSAMLERYLGVSLAKAHSAADWSRRPLPQAWLAYAALDVELLIELRDLLAAQLAGAGRAEWAAEEFEAVRTAGPPEPRVDPWRRVKGLSTRSPRTLAIARELWLARDRLASRMDRAPSKILPDSTIAALAASPPASRQDLDALPAMRHQKPDRLRAWWGAIEAGRAVRGDQLPSLRAANSGPPNPRSWDRIDPLAAARLEAARSVLSQLAERVGMPRENLLAPRVVRDSVWRLSGQPAPDSQTLAQLLADEGARRWQIDQVADRLAAAIAGAKSPEPAAGQ